MNLSSKIPFLFEQKSGPNGPYMEITGYEGSAARVLLPQTIEDLPVTSIGSFAFAGNKSIREIRIPASVKTLRLFAFQNCTSLEKISLTNETDDYYDGVIRGCSALTDIEVSCIRDNNYVIVKEFLADTDQMLRFHLKESGRDLRLTFPEYTNEAREDTMARAIHFTIEGGGMAYRECVGKYALNLTEYDSLLTRLTDYDFEAAMDICLGRLMCPSGLERPAKERYRNYLLQHGAQVLDRAIRQNLEDMLTFLADQDLIPEEDLIPAIRSASELRRTELSAILMAYQGRKSAAAPKEPAALSLDDW